MTAHRAWASMKQICLNAKHPRYKNYGGRGITISSSWWKYAGFLADMGEAPLHAALSRRDFNLGFSKENCYWRHGVTVSERPMYVNNSSGYKGVTLHRRSGRYMAYATVAGKQKSLGYFPNPAAASEAREEYLRGSQ